MNNNTQKLLEQFAQEAFVQAATLANIAKQAHKAVDDAALYAFQADKDAAIALALANRIQVAANK